MQKYASSLNSGINAWNWNTNCNLNTNNRNNSLSVWPFLELFHTDELRDLAIPIDEWWYYYRKSRKGKNGKVPQILFALQSTRNINEIAYSVGNFELVLHPCTLFVVEKPVLREIIAAAVPDKIIQSLFVSKARPYIDDMIPKYSCSCQIGKGGLYAVQRACELMKIHPDGIVFKLDLQNCFPSFDTAYWADRLISILQERMPDGPERNTILYLARIIYLTRPQDRVIRVCAPENLGLVNPAKSLRTKDGNIGLALGNEASQFIVNFATSFMLRILDEWGIGYVLYTDDVLGVVSDFHKLEIFLPEYTERIKRECHFTLHPRKRYFQPVKHGVPFLSAFISGNGEPFPSKRIVHNAFERLRLLVQWAENDRGWMYSHPRQIADSLCSYLALMRHYHSYGIRKRLCSGIMESVLSEVVYVDTEVCLKVVVRPEWIMRNRCSALNRKTRHLIFNTIQLCKLIIQTQSPKPFSVSMKKESPSTSMS